MPVLDLRQTLLVPKPTKVEYDSKRWGVAVDELRARYGADADLIFGSHERQLAMRRLVQSLLPEARVVERQEYSGAAGASLVVALGGDNHFIFVSHGLDSTPILGINSDRVRSHGGLLSIDERNVGTVIAKLREGECSIQAWTRLEAAVDGRPVGLATSEIYIGEQSRLAMSRHVLRLDDGPEEEHRSSGLLVATGAGSTGWFGAYDRPFDRTQRMAQWQLMEAFPYNHKYRYAAGELGPGSVLSVRSRNDHQGILALDSQVAVPMPRGSTATLRISPQSLRVIWT